MSESTDTLISEFERLQVVRSSGSGPESANGNALHSAFAISPMAVTELLWSQRRLVSRSMLAALLIFTAFAFLLPKHYTATTQLMPPDYGNNSELAMVLPALGDQGGSTSGGGGILGMASQLLGMNTSGDLFIGVIQSESVEDRVIAKLGLMKVYSDKYPEDARKDLESHTKVTTDAKSGLISISVDDKSPARAAEIAKAYVSELNQVLAEVNTSSAHRERLFLEERLDQVRQQSDADAKEFALFASQNAAVDIPNQAKAMVEAGAELQSELIVAQSELKGLEQIYSDNNARVKSVKARVEELQRQVDKFGGKNVNPNTDSSLSQNELYPSVRQLPLLGVRYLDLYRRSKVDDAVFELLTKEYEVAKIEEAKSVPTAQVLDVALVPQKKSSPHRLWIMLGGVMLGLMFSSGYLVGREVWDHTDDAEPKKILAREVYLTLNQWLRRLPHASSQT